MPGLGLFGRENAPKRGPNELVQRATCLHGRKVSVFGSRALCIGNVGSFLGIYRISWYVNQRSPKWEKSSLINSDIPLVSSILSEFNYDKAK